MPELHEAAEHGDIETVRRLFDTGTPIDQLDERNESAIRGAAAFGHTDVVRLLLERGAAERSARYRLDAGSSPAPGALFSSRTIGRSARRVDRGRFDLGRLSPGFLLHSKTAWAISSLFLFVASNE
jgi:ankyrin repeat protein